MTNARMSRRALLRSMGVGAACLPLLEVEQARAAEAARKRLVLINFPNGVHPPEFWPTGDETNFTFGKISEPMAPFKQDLLVLGGLDQSCFIGNTEDTTGRTSQAGWGHDAYLSLFTGTRFQKYWSNHYIYAGGDSLDQVVADDLRKRGVNTPIASLVVGARTGSGPQSTVSARANTQGITPESDPAKLFATLFGGRALPKAELDTLRAERKSLLDYVGKSLEGFGRRMGTDDKQKIQAHLQSVREIEKQFTGEAPVTGCTAPPAPGPVDFKKVENHPALLKVQMDLIAAALRCDLTRVVSYTVTNTGGSGVVFSWLGEEFTGKGDEYPIRDHHDIAHMQGRSAAHLARYVNVNRWYYEQFAYFVKQLKDAKEGSGSVLDQSAVVITNVSGSNHMATGLPFMVVGRCGGAFRTGRLLKFGDWAGKTGTYFRNKGIPHNGLLTSLANAMGVDVKAFGDPQFGTGPLPGLG